MNKKSSLSGVLLVIIIAIAALVAIIYFLGPKFFGVLRTGNETIKMTADYDNDGIANMYDKCCPKDCDPKGEEIETDLDSERLGCTEDQEITECTTDPEAKCNKVELVAGEYDGLP